jgi:hypothetical protein
MIMIRATVLVNHYANIFLRIAFSQAENFEFMFVVVHEVPTPIASILDPKVKSSSRGFYFYSKFAFH